MNFTLSSGRVAGEERAFGKGGWKLDRCFYISHRLDEVRRLSHRITALRDGAHVGELTPEQATREAMVTLMAGRPPKAGAQPIRDITTRETVLEVQGLSRDHEFED